MPYRIECLGCKEYVYLEEIKKENTSYPCDACNAPNWLSGTYSKFQEIDDTNSSDKSSTQTHDKINKYNSQSLSDKYSILELMKGLAYFMMLVVTGFIIYSLVQISDASQEMKKFGVESSMDNTMLTLVITYVITMFSLFCLTKIIDFLFDLDLNKSNK